MLDKIIIRGARQHNLKNINCEIPKNKLIVFTGLSGSGKSSLAFDTIYAEGQRRYVESLSSYARQFLGIMDKPDVESIEGLSPAISIDQKSTSHNPRSTVGTITEIYDYLRLLFARLGSPHCPRCNRLIERLSLDEIKNAVLEIIQKSNLKNPRFLILSPLVKDRKGEYTKLFQNLKSKGFQKVRIDKQIYSLNEDLVLIKTNKHTIEAVVDKISLDLKGTNWEEFKQRLHNSLEQALRLSDGTVILSKILDPSFTFPEKPQKFEDVLFSEKLACPICQISLPEIEPRSFSFNTPQGACPACSGLGTKLNIDPSLVINPELSILEGGILPFARMTTTDTWFKRLLEQVCLKANIDMTAPLKNLTQKQMNLLLYGEEDEIYTVSGPNRYGRRVQFEQTYEGIISNLERRYKETESEWSRQEIEKYMRLDPCLECKGKRLKKEALSITILGKSIADLTEMSIEKIYQWFKDYQKTIASNPRQTEIAKPILKEILNRLNFLIDVGLDYLTLDRSANTLSGGESQRIRLASQIGSGLSGVLYILDEPSIGLHQKDNYKLIETLKKLRDLGNSIIVVEHDRETMENADYIFDFGPQAGEHGGKIIAFGTPAEIKNHPQSLTGKYLSGKKEILILKNYNLKRHPELVSASIKINSSTNQDDKSLTIFGASHHNLKNINVSFPLGKFICVTGVSGSGKSTLINDILYHALAQKFNPFHKEKPGKFKELRGWENLNKVLLIDQSPIGRTPRSNPATYTGVFTFIRELFALTKEARIRGYNPGRFSFNVKGGRCEACAGEGKIKIEMQFLPDIYVNCEVCHGKRYNEEALEITYQEKNISEVLDMSVEEALQFFKGHLKIEEKLLTLKKVGLDYLKLGQPAPTLSGGEAQRIKISSELGKRATGKTIYLLDEPTTGLHFKDLENLLLVLQSLVKKGNTVIVIEHNLEVIKNADYIIDLGPEGGDRGGEVIATGSPWEISQNPHSYTGQCLKKILK